MSVSMEVIRVERVREGRCPQCGTQTHSFTVDSVPQKIGLDIEGQILRGRCLFCKPLLARIVKVAAASDKHEQEKEVDKPHCFRVGDCVKILRDKKGRENEIATVITVSACSVKVKIGTGLPFYKRYATIQKIELMEETELSEEDSSENESELVGKCEICEGYGVAETFCEMDSCKDAHIMYT
jgi:hypothetical protein